MLKSERSPQRRPSKERPDVFSSIFLVTRSDEDFFLSSQKRLFGLCFRRKKVVKTCSFWPPKADAFLFSPSAPLLLLPTTTPLSPSSFPSFPTPSPPPPSSFSHQNDHPGSCPPPRFYVRRRGSPSKDVNLDLAHRRKEQEDGRRLGSWNQL